MGEAGAACVYGARRARRGVRRSVVLGVGEQLRDQDEQDDLTGVDSVVLGVKNRAELAECVAAAERGLLDADLVTAIDASVAPGT